MRRVCGCTPASSAATEITYTARVRSLGSGRALIGVPPARQRAIAASRRAMHCAYGSLADARSLPGLLHAEGGPGRGPVAGRRQRPARPALLGAELLRPHHLDRDEHVAG